MKQFSWGAAFVEVSTGKTKILRFETAQRSLVDFMQYLCNKIIVLQWLGYVLLETRESDVEYDHSQLVVN